MSSEDQIVFIVDGDRSVFEAVSHHLSTLRSRVVAFRSAAEYIASPRADVPACLILDVRLSDANGLDLQERIADTVHPPIVFVTGHGDVPSSVRALKAGAVDFLTQPINERDLVKAIDAAIAQDRNAREERTQLTQLRQHYSRLSPRERQVLPLVIGGRLNKQAAAELGISETTVQIHRRRIMRKMAAGSLAELVRMASALKVPLPGPRPTWRACAS